ncbi:chromate resistance protein ChrB domain-containing protein [Streptomyces sp. NPDC101145]|uniref:chromate resistance protein ChrB domain-containing protein n=1 Tax=Streptomyces sp. NPDC101145 TaxID=3366112 RepID=UPI00382E37F0
MKWATRAGIHIDRAACAWLIRRFIDPDAEFVFVTDPAHVPADATPFDMRGAELGHHRGDCSFETILRVHHLTDDPALRRIADIVHEADIDDERFHAPRSPRSRRRPARPVHDRRRPPHHEHRQPRLRRPLRVLPARRVLGP